MRTGKPLDEFEKCVGNIFSTKRASSLVLVINIFSFIGCRSNLNLIARLTLTQALNTVSYEEPWPVVLLFALSSIHLISGEVKYPSTSNLGDLLISSRSRVRSSESFASPLGRPCKSKPFPQVPCLGEEKTYPHSGKLGKFSHLTDNYSSAWVPKYLPPCQPSAFSCG